MVKGQLLKLHTGIWSHNTPQHPIREVAWKAIEQEAP